MMDRHNFELVNTFIKECERNHFPVRGIPLSELMKRVENQNESFIYFALPHQKKEILEKTTMITRWLVMREKLPTIWCVEIPDPPDFSGWVNHRCEGWMPGENKEQIFKSMEYFNKRTHGDHCYYIQECESLDIEEFI